MVAIKRYSPNTIATYSEALKHFTLFSRKSIPEIDNNDVILFNNNYILDKKLSESYQNQIVNAIKLFFKIVLTPKLTLTRYTDPNAPKYYPLSKEG
jgi:integrase/recombinase XerD